MPTGNDKRICFKPERTSLPLRNGRLVDLPEMAVDEMTRIARRKSPGTGSVIAPLGQTTIPSHRKGSGTKR
jgi:hypothetical protein